MIDHLDEMYSSCITRIDPYAIEEDGTINDDRFNMAESLLIGGITLLKRKSNGRADRDRIREDIKFDRGLDKYEEEIRKVFNSSDEYLSDLIAESIDLSHLVDHIKYIVSVIKKADLRGKEQKTQAGRARKAVTLLQKLTCKLKPVPKAKRKKLVLFRVKNLFGGEE